MLTEFLRTDPAARPTALAAKRMLEDVYGGAVPIVPLRLAAPPRRRRTAVLAGAVAVALLATGGAVVYLDQDPESAPAAAGAVLDIGTADPCAVLDKSSLSRFGSGLLLDRDYGLFGQCGVTVRLSPAPEDVGYVGLFLERIPEYEAANYPLGKLGPIEKPAERDDEHCERAIPLPDGNRVRIDAYNQGARLAEPCDMAQAVADRTLDMLRSGPVPRRETPFPRSSLAHVNACDTLAAADLRAVMGADPTPEPELGNWTCYWDFGPEEVTVEFSREWREPPDDDEQPVTVGTHTAVRDTSDDACSIAINGREYTAVNPNNDEWVEIATVTLDTDDGTGNSLCDRVTPLAVAVEARLPSA